MKILVTGANGFVGQVLTRELVAAGHVVTGAVGPGPEGPPGAVIVPLDLTAARPLGRVDVAQFDAVVHLAAVASGSDARRDPGLAWTVNTVGTVRLLEEFGRCATGGGGGPVFLMVSTCDVYRPVPVGSTLSETSPTQPGNAYSASKLAAEVACLEVARRTGLKVVIARPFPHSGAGQDTRFVVPDFARKILAARRDSTAHVRVGNMSLVREMLDVRDVVRAYAILIERGKVGNAYNVARGVGYRLDEVYDRICELVGFHPKARPSTQNVEETMAVVGTSGKLFEASGWQPAISLDQTLNDVVEFQRSRIGLA